MVMKVDSVYNVLFKANQPITKTDIKPSTPLQIQELQAVTPDYAVKKPNKYTLIKVDELINGQKIYSYKLGNGHRVTIVPMEGSPAVVKNYVNVGSLNETDDIKGISHFLEHMAFNGTKGSEGYTKLNQGDPFNKIDKLGGWTNASTNYALTDYVNSTPLLESKDLEEQIKVLAAMTEDLALTKDMVEKEKGPVCSEINMILDNPQTIAIDQTVRSLFNIKSSADELVGGSVEHIKNLNQDKVKAYYDKYYTPDNMNLVITGDIDPQKTIELVAKNFKSNKTRIGNIYEENIQPILKTIRKDFISDKATSTEIILGFSGPKNNDTKSKLIFDIVSNYLEQTDTGIVKELKKLNTYPMLGLEKISTNPNNPTLLYYAMSCSDDKSEQAIKVLYDKISSLKTPSQKELDLIKEDLLLSYKNMLEYSGTVNNIIGTSILNQNEDLLINYEKILNSISPQDIENFIKNHINFDRVAITMVHPQTTQEAINSNYLKAQQLSFKGKHRTPINMDKVTEYRLDNNYRVGFYETKNDNISFDINLHCDGTEINPAARRVLDQIYSMGTMNSNEDEFNKFKEENNLHLYANIHSNGINISGSGSNKNIFSAVDKAKEMLERPRIKQEEMDRAIERIKDNLNRAQDTAMRLYINEESKTNPLYHSKEEVLNALDNLTLEDVQELHNYMLRNSYATVSMNVPEKLPEIKEIALEKFEGFRQVKPYKLIFPDVYKDNLQAKVLTKEKPVSQADIMQIYKFPVELGIKEEVVAEITNTLLSSSQSIGLFNSLREKEHLAYSVYSTINRCGNSGELSCNILTTTDNKEIGEISYENVQKSINGFHRQINMLKNSEYTDDDLENAKRMLKADLLYNEGIFAKLDNISAGLNSLEGIDYCNQLYNIIDNITREDISYFTQKVFKNPPTYSIVASKDTLEANKDFFNKLMTQS